MPGLELFRSFLQQASVQGSRSTALNPLGWALATVLAALIGAVMQRAPIFICIMLASFSGAILLVYIIAYLYLMVKLPDALRSERFTLSKMAIERSMTGDNIAGFLTGDEALLLHATEPKPTSEE